MKLKAAIIGAGRIGASLDYPQSAHVITHAHGYMACDGYEIVGFVDQDLGKAEAASKHWGGDVFENIEDLFEKQEIDVVSVCVPDELHYDTMLELAEKPLKCVFLEKPPVRTPTEADKILALYDELPVKVQVNYTRRFVPEIRNIEKAIKRGDYGEFLNGTGYYGKGLLHNGSHMIDLLRFLIGEVDAATKIGESVDFAGDDPSVSSLLTLCNGRSFYLRHIDYRKFDIFEMDLIFERKRIRVVGFGSLVEEYSVKDNEVFIGHRSLAKENEYPTDHQRAIFHALTNIRAHLERDEALLCPLEDALTTVKTCAKIAGARSG